MDIKIAAKETKKLIDCSFLPSENPDNPVSSEHLHEMREKMINGEIVGEKAHRWLGWVQALVCVGEGASLEELKLINYKA